MIDSRTAVSDEAEPPDETIRRLNEEMRRLALTPAVGMAAQRRPSVSDEAVEAFLGAADACAVQHAFDAPCCVRAGLEAALSHLVIGTETVDRIRDHWIAEGRRQAAEAIRTADTSGWHAGRQSEVDDHQESAARIAEGATDADPA
jgi:hypothetical protein